MYGRRRVGKTYLIREFFLKKKCKLFHATGLQNGTQKKQLKKFTEAISDVFFENAPLATPVNWDDAFVLLNKQILKSAEKVVVFLEDTMKCISYKFMPPTRINYGRNYSA